MDKARQNVADSYMAVKHYQATLDDHVNLEKRQNRLGYEITESAYSNVFNKRTACNNHTG